VARAGQGSLAQGLKSRPGSTRLVDLRESEAVLEIVERDPVANVFVSSRVRTAVSAPWGLGGELWGHPAVGPLESLCYAGANLFPVEAGPEAVRAFAERGRRQRRRCSSIVGPAAAVDYLWRLLEPDWGPARDVRQNQPLMATSAPSPVPPDPAVRRVRPDELDILLPACVAMFTEEVGVSPLAGDGGALYRTRVAELVNSGRSFARIEDGAVVFKAEIGLVSPGACQVQGVWVAPGRRGERLSIGGMAAVVDHALREVAPVVSLYVNDFNLAARRSYRSAGFAEVGAFMSVLF
jgi:predicted GNAT family acetyltransferase